MKWLVFFLIFLLAIGIAASQYEIKGFVNDYAGVLTQEEISAIEYALVDIYEHGAAQMAVVIIPSLEGRDIVGYAYELAQGNLGDTEKNNGILLLISVQDRLYRIEVGRGLEAIIPDILAGRIARDHLVPSLKVDGYGKGILETTEAIQEALKGEYAQEIVVNPAGEIIGPVIMVISLSIFFIIIFANIVSTPRRKNRRNDEEIFTAAWLLSSMMRGGRGGGGGSFGGFGGGSFGGGGASGRF